ncbi:MAG: beta-ketoacyl-[acyl-carrier-protein] synthase family protein [Betaproteobacteria bacterium]|nr:MAG: beta-ketoacyl-[acyl-carrier-protein] synthase family protein [Betaproteobacteria bacterium]
MQPLVISRFSVVNSLGRGTESMLRALREKRSGLAPCGFETARIDTYVGPVPELDDFRVRLDLQDYDCRNNRLAQLCLEQDGFAKEIAAARDRYGAGRIGLYLGTSTSGLHTTELAYRRRDPKTGALPADYRYAKTQNAYSLGEFVRRYLGLAGPGFVVSSACSSSAKVLGNAARMIAAGICDAAVVGGVDSLCLMTLYGFHSLGLTSAGPCRPYDVDRDGISIGEGGGFALLERAERVESGAIQLLGVGESSDAYHMSTPHPEGLGARIAMQQALDSAGLEPSDIDYVNLHGTATRSNDASEDKAVFEVFGRQTPCSSTKGATGHLLGAAGITEAIISVLAIEDGLMPGSANTRSVDPALKCNYLLENRRAKVTRALTNSFGFGGSNCSLVLGVAQ